MGDSVFTLIVFALFGLAVIDLIVGVSNDAVNFLNSAIGSKTISYKNILIVASFGVLIGAFFSGGMMEVARKGIFIPGQFNFNDIMIIFITVMLTDVLLLDFFNSLGMPTSTTVSIVFELLGASVAIALLKIGKDNESIANLFNYINTKKAIEIILGIVLSVFFAFNIGAITQFITRLILTFKYNKRPKYISIIFGGIAITSIIYFLLIKGLKNSSFIDTNMLMWIKESTFDLIFIVFLCSTVFSASYVLFFKSDIYKFIIVLGTFSLAMAFAGNDLVNFIGVPIAGWQSFEIWQQSDLTSDTLKMGLLAGSVPAPSLFLLFSGLIMILTLWLSKRGQNVVQTSIDLSDQNYTKERFKPNFLSKLIVRITVVISNFIFKITPSFILNSIEKRFITVTPLPNAKKGERVAFDSIRASVNLMVSSILISIATSMKLPLSTTYVTFMVAMGTSFSDKAWGVDSAVYRVAGVLNVIGGWFLTAIIAFITTAILAYFITISGSMGIIILLIAVAVVLYKNYRKKLDVSPDDQLSKAESKNVKEMIYESAINVSKVIKRTEKIYHNVIEGLATKNLVILKKTKKKTEKLNIEIQEIQESIFYYIRNSEETLMEPSRFYIMIIRYLYDFIQSMDFITKMGYTHIDNNHKGLTFSQISDLKDIEQSCQSLFEQVKLIYKDNNFSNIDDIIKGQDYLSNTLDEYINKQIQRTKTDESSPKNTTLYFSLLLETKDLINSMMQLLKIYNREYAKLR